jgi:DNA-3-methyladenine glycosylase
MKLEPSFYLGNNVVKIARSLLGKVLYTRIGRRTTAGMIVETEAYSSKERGCHAYLNRRTSRNEVMFGDGGHAYVYLCYGIHELFNVVTNETEEPEAVLIRALEPMEGVRWMKERMNAATEKRITSGPGKLTKALGIDRSMNGKALWSGQLWIEDAGIKIARESIIASSRIGIDYAGQDAHLPWRFTIKDNVWVSKSK